MAQCPVEKRSNFCDHSINGASKPHTACLSHSFLTMNAQTAKQFLSLFTAEQWDAIDSAMADFADYGEQEAETADSIQAIITELYKATA